MHGGKIEFPYLGSFNSRIDVEVKKRIASNFKAFGTLRQDGGRYTGPVDCLSCGMVVNARYHSEGTSRG
jgi:hypothetical protein